jgi:DNA-binding NarL/FixJ family response regulator
MGRARVLLAEDHPRVAEELRRLLEREFEVIAVVDDGDELLRVAADTHPDVVVSDVAMPGRDGIAATLALVGGRPEARVVLVTVHDDPELAERGYAAGALAYVLKLAATRDLVPAVRAALRGERYVPAHGLRPGLENPGPPGSRNRDEPRR